MSEVKNPKKLISKGLMKDKFGNSYVREKYYNQEMQNKDSTIAACRLYIRGLEKEITKKDNKIARIKEENDKLEKRVEESLKWLKVFLHK